MTSPLETCASGAIVDYTERIGFSQEVRHEIGLRQEVRNEQGNEGERAPTVWMRQEIGEGCDPREPAEEWGAKLALEPETVHTFTALVAAERFRDFFRQRRKKTTHSSRLDSDKKTATRVGGDRRQIGLDFHKRFAMRLNFNKKFAMRLDFVKRSATRPSPLQWRSYRHSQRSYPGPGDAPGVEALGSVVAGG